MSAPSGTLYPATNDSANTTGPGGIGTAVSTGQPIYSAYADTQSSAIIAIETVLGTNPEGTDASVAAALVARARKTDVQNQTPTYAVDSGPNGSTYVVTLSPVPASYLGGMLVCFKANNTSNSGPTLNVNGMGAVALVKGGSTAVAAGDIVAGQIVTVVYDADSPTAHFQIQGFNANTISQPDVNDFRLTLSSGVAVTTSDLTGAGTIYLTPDVGTRVSLYDGTSTWTTYTTAQVSLALSGVASSTNYDVFCYANSGVPTLELGPAWTNDTTRATALVRQDGVWVKSGATTRRWVGILRGTGTNITEDSAARRFLCNAVNRAPRILRATSTTGGTASSTSFAQLNSVQVEYLTEGEQGVSLTGKATCYNAGSATFVLGVGSAATTAAANCVFGSAICADTTAATGSDTLTFLQEANAAGHYVRYLIYKVITNVTTIRQDNSPQTGLFGTVLG